MKKNYIKTFENFNDNKPLSKSDFNLSEYTYIEDSLAKTLEEYDEAYLVCFPKNGDYYHSEVHEGGYFIGSDDFAYSNDSNIGFDSATEAETYYNNDCNDYIVFSDEADRDKFIEDNLE